MPLVCIAGTVTVTSPEPLWSCVVMVTLGGTVIGLGALAVSARPQPLHTVAPGSNPVAHRGH